MRHRSNKFDSKLTVPVAIHQAATGYVMPSFSLMLGASAHPALISHVGAHELALAGIIGLIISAREIFVHE